MTFTEAAAQVLRLVGKPLHYKEITEVAIEKNLLSHVGKSPDVTMGARLTALVKKGEKDNPLVRVKPGVFALKEWDDQTIQRGLADRTPALQRIAGKDFEVPEPNRTPVVEEGDPDDDELLLSGEEDDAEEPSSPDAAEVARAELAAVAGELFAPEADDDEPILGALDEEPEAGARAEGAEREGGSKRRRRRKRRGGREEDDGDDLPSYTVSDAPAEILEGSADAGAEAERPREERGREERGREERSRDGERARGREERGREDRARDGERGREDRARDGERGREDRARDGERGRDDRGRDGEAGGREATGLELSDAIAKTLGGFDRSSGPVTVTRLIEQLQRRERLSLGDGNPAHVVLAAMRADNLQRQGRGLRPRFRVSEQRVAMLDWAMDGEQARLDRELVSLLDRYAETARRGVVRRLQDLPQRALGELIGVLLERAGVRNLRPVRRPGTHGAELHLAGELELPTGGTVAVAIVVRRDGREVGRERVSDLRGSLHHYGAAAAGWLITTGQVLSGAREEASASGAAPVSLTDGMALARLCEQHGVGVLRQTIQLPLADLELFESLRSN